MNLGYFLSAKRTMGGHCLGFVIWGHLLAATKTKRGPCLRFVILGHLLSAKTKGDTACGF